VFNNKTKKKSRKVPQITPDYLREEAQGYLARYTGSANRVKTVLFRRVRKSMTEHGGAWGDYERMISELILQLEDGGLLDDDRYASEQAQQHSKKGYSKIIIRKKLHESQFRSSAINFALKEIESDSAEKEIERACAYVRRRRLGIFRRQAPSLKEKRRDYGAVVRAGFPFAVVTRVMACKTEEDFELLELECHEAEAGRPY
jgi:regulatory protein